MKFSVVPDSSERCTGEIFVEGSLASGFSLAMAGSFHVVIFSLKILPIVEAESWRLSTPSTLNTTAMGLT